MKTIVYTPTEQLNDTIFKYGVDFKAGVPVDVENDALAERLLTNIYFSESVTVQGVEVLEAPKKRKRRTKAEIEADNAKEQD